MKFGMKMIAAVAAVVVGSSFAGCAANVDESVDIEEPGRTEEGRKNEPVTCPVYTGCPYSLPGYPVFMHAVNDCSTAITCWYRNDMVPTGMASTTVSIPQQCPVCRPTGNSDPCCNDITYVQGWTCTQQ